MTGATGAMAGAASGDSIEDKVKNAAIGASLGVIHKGARTYGTPIVSRAIDTAGKALSKTPLSAVGELTSPALSAAERSPGALANTARVLSDPRLEKAAETVRVERPPV